MTTKPPAAVVAELHAHPRLPDGDGERFTGFGVMGLPFGGHYLALRDMAATSLGPAYRTFWYRDPDGGWSIFATIDPDLSCPRYFGAACSHVEQVPSIDIAWTGDSTFTVQMGDRLSWQVGLASTVSTRLMSRLGVAMPPRAWRSEPLMGAMGPMAGPMLRSGRIRMRGTTPSGHHFRAAPKRLWRVTSSHAVFDGVELGDPRRLDRQDHLADFWLPQRGLSFLADATFVQPTTRTDAAEVYAR